MTTIEIAQSEYDTLNNVKKMVDTLWNDPDKGIIVKELVKDKFPQTNIPEVDALRLAKRARDDASKTWEDDKKSLLERIEKSEALIKERDDAYKQREEEAKFQSEVEQVRKKHSLTPEGMEKVFARMKEKNNPDIESAAAYVISQEPKQNPVNSNVFTPSTIDMFGANTGSDEWKELNEAVLNNKTDQWFDRTAAKVLEEFNNAA